MRLLSSASLARIVSLLALSACVLLPGAAHAQAPANPYDYTRSSEFVYDAAGFLTDEIAEPDNPAACVKTTYQYDAAGNKTIATKSNCTGASGAALFVARAIGNGYAAQTATVAGVAGVMTPAGTFSTSSTNALGQQETMVVDPRFGTPASLKGPNLLTTSWELDGFGRKVKEIRADGSSSIMAYCYIEGKVADRSSNSATCPVPGWNEAPSDAIKFVHTEPRGPSGVKNGAFSRAYMDRAGRTIRTVSEAFDGPAQAGGNSRLIAQDTDHNELGAAFLTTEPYFLDTGSSLASGYVAYGMNTTVFDALGRPVKTYRADPLGSQASISFGARGLRQAAVVTVSYNGLDSTITDDKNQSRTEEKNILGKLIRVTDGLGGQMAYQYDAFNNMVISKDALLNTLTFKFDVAGRKLEMTDPDTGRWQYRYNALGELVWQESPNQRALGQATSMAYDHVGRLITRTEPEYTSNWVFDNCSNGIGKLCATSTSHGVSRKFAYDSYGRNTSNRTSVAGGPSFASSVTYDSTTGRLDSRTYPTGLRVNYQYTPKGFVSGLTLATPSSGVAVAGPLWTAQSYNAWNRAEQQTFGNNIVGKMSFEPATGRVETITAGSGGSAAAMNHAYVWNSLDQLRGRTDGNGDGVTGAVTDNFVYDTIGRLESYSVAAPAIPNLSRSVTIKYNAVGSILYKSDVGTYSYAAQGPGSVRPHAVQQVSGAFNATYAYDANGNVKAASAGKYRSISYTSFNLPDSQTGLAGPSGLPRYTWQYDENHQRLKETRFNASGTRTTWMLHPDNAGGLAFERELNGAAASNRHYLSTGSSTIGVLVSSGDLPVLADGQTAPPQIASIAVTKVEYWHKDHLDSLVATTDQNGTVTARYSYDPFGKRRTASGNYDANGNLVIDWDSSAGGTDRGYTGHEHLDDVGLVHMNGRVFDPLLGRFMQGDPAIQDPFNMQNYDRYSYCYNNPMTCTDPTGYFSFRRWIGATLRFVLMPTMKNLFRAIRAQPGQERIDKYIMSHSWAMTLGQIIVAYYAGPKGAAMWAAYYAYQATGSMNAAVKAGAVSYGTSMAFTAVGDYLNAPGGFGEGSIQGVALHGVVGCVSSVAGGAKCGPGAMSAAFSHAMTPTVADFSKGSPLGGTLASAMVGGTASVISGGKFSNGAATSAFGYLFNHLYHENTAEVKGMHQRLALRDDAGNMLYSMSFGMNDSGGHPIFGNFFDGSFSGAPDPGTYVGDDRNGEVYVDRAPATQVNKVFLTTPKEDLMMYNYMRSRIGDTGPYNVLTNSCRSFSDAQYYVLRDMVLKSRGVSLVPKRHPRSR